LLEERELELEVFLDQQEDLALGERQARLRCGGRIVVVVRRRRIGRGGLELVGEDVLEDEAAEVPDGVVFWVVVQKTRDELERGVGVVVSVDLVGVGVGVSVSVSASLPLMI
jgi:hypothetical protein